MVSTMDIVPSSTETPTSTDLCDNRAIIDFPIIPASINCDQLTKNLLKLDLTTQREKGSIDEDEKSGTAKIKSPKSPLTNISEYIFYL